MVKIKQRLLIRKLNKSNRIKINSKLSNCNLQISGNPEIQIGTDVFCQEGCAIKVRDRACLRIGNFVTFNNNCVLTCRNRIMIGNNVLIGPNTIIFDHDHNYRSDDFIHDFVLGDIVIGNNVWISGNCIILKGTIIEDNCVIGAGTLVNGYVPANTVVYNKRETTMKTIRR